jgi:glycosyltransferase involved in cell wall biosynthesis
MNNLKNKTESSISVVITTYNRPAEVKDAVNSLLTQSIKPLEILVIDDSSNPPVHMQTDDKKLKLIRFEKELGLSNTRNYGINIAKGEYVAFMDDDCIASELWIEELQKGVKLGADVLGGPLRPKFMATPPEWWDEKTFGTYVGVGNIFSHEILGANMVFRKAIFGKIGFFNPLMGRQKGKLFGAEETELIKKAKTCCKVLFVPTAEVFHRVPSERLTLRYIIRWSYYWGKTDKLLSGLRIRDFSYALTLAVLMALHPLNILKKSYRVKRIARFAMLIGRVV